MSDASTALKKLEKARAELKKIRGKLKEAKRRRREWEDKVRALEVQEEQASAETDRLKREFDAVVNQPVVEAEEDSQDAIDKCVICLRVPRRATLSECCSRVIGCRRCCEQVHQRTNTCPVCRHTPFRYLIPRGQGGEEGVDGADAAAN